MPQLALTGDPTVRFDPLKITWIGSMSAYATDSYILAINASHPLKKIEDAAREGMKLRIGSNRSGSTNLTIAIVAQHALSIRRVIGRRFADQFWIMADFARDMRLKLFADFRIGGVERVFLVGPVGIDLQIMVERIR